MNSQEKRSILFSLVLLVGGIAHLSTSLYEMCYIYINLAEYLEKQHNINIVSESCFFSDKTSCSSHFFLFNLALQCVVNLKLIFLLVFTLQVLQGGGLESPTKPKGRPKKNSIPSSEQLSEQERSAADPHSEGSSSHLESTQEE